MKLFYCGSVCNQNVFDETVEKSKIKPSASAQNFELALIKGFLLNDNVDLTIASCESIAPYPNGCRFFLKKRKDLLLDQCYANIVPAINLPFLKQYFHAKGTAKLFKKWIKTNKDEKKAILMYAIYPKVAKKMIKLSAKYDCKIFATITDVPSTMFTYTKSRNILKRIFSGSYRKKAIEVQDKFDGYVYLTEQMSNEVCPGKPYIVIETLADESLFDNIQGVKKDEISALMYAGMLYKKYGTDLIIDTFENIKTNCELWLFGSGDYESEIILKAKQNPKIKFFGRVSRQEILNREKEATILLNLRRAEDTYTKYSFPSKMIEYMLSGTPVFTTRLPGIPDEYYDYVYSTDQILPKEIANELDLILTSRKENIAQKGKEAQIFVKENKNAQVQVKKIIDFLNSKI